MMIVLLRHGQTTWNRAGILIGQRDIPLDAGGHQEARRVVRSLTGIDAIYSSPLSRCQETAAILAEATGAEIVIDERLCEIDMAPHEGKTWKESTEQAEAQDLQGEPEHQPATRRFASSKRRRRTPTRGSSSSVPIGSGPLPSRPGT